MSDKFLNEVGKSSHHQDAP